MRLTQDGGEATLVARRDDRVAPGVVLVSAAHASTAGLPMMFGPITARKVAAAAGDCGTGQPERSEQVS